MFDSAILGFLYKLYVKAGNAFKNSATVNLMSAFGRVLAGLFMGSTLLRPIYSAEHSSGYYDGSSIFFVFQKILDVITDFFRKIFDRISVFAQSSLIVNALLKTAARTDLVICLFVFIYSIVPHANWSNAYNYVMSAILLLLYFIKCVADKNYNFDLRKIDIAFALFILTVFIATVTSIDIMGSLKTFSFLLSSLVMFYVIINVFDTKQKLYNLLYTVIAAVTVMSLYGFWQILKGIPIDASSLDMSSGGVIMGRVFSTMENANNFAEFLVLSIPLYAAIFFTVKNNFIKLFVAALAVLPILNLYETISRSSWIGIAVAFGIFIFFKNKKLIPLIIVLGIAAIPFIPATLIDRLYSIGKDSSSLYRVGVWQGALRILQDYWVTGIGPGSGPFTVLFQRVSNDTVPVHSHMLFLQIWIETGLLGIVSFLWFIIRILKKSVFSIIKRGDFDLNHIIIAGLSAIVGLFAVGGVEYVWFYPRIQNMFWIVMGILICAMNLNIVYNSREDAQNIGPEHKQAA